MSMMGMEVVKENENENGDKHSEPRNRTGGAVIKKKTTEWYGKAKVPSRDDLPEDESNDESQRPMEGNWI